MVCVLRLMRKTTLTPEETDFLSVCVPVAFNDPLVFRVGTRLR